MIEQILYWWIFIRKEKKEEVGRIRPAIIVSDSDLNDILDLVTVIPLSTNLIDDALPLRVKIKRRENLKKDSDAMVENIKAISKDRIIKKLSIADKDEMQLIQDGIKKLLCL